MPVTEIKKDIYWVGVVDVGQGLLAEALGDAGALQPQTQLASDGPPLLVTAGGGGSAFG